MFRTEKSGANRRASLEASARHGNPEAIAALVEPEFPDAIEYIWDDFMELNGMRSEGMNGVAGFTPEMIAAWLHIFDHHREPHELKALFEVDSAFRDGMRAPVDPLETKGQQFSEPLNAV